MDLLGNRTVNFLAGKLQPGKIWLHVGTNYNLTKDVLLGIAVGFLFNGWKVGYFTEMDVQDSDNHPSRDIDGLTVLEDLGPDSVRGLDVILFEPHEEDVCEVFPEQEDLYEYEGYDNSGEYKHLLETALVIGIHLSEDFPEDVPSKVFEADLISFACLDDENKVEIRGWASKEMVP